jgi:hypothetical protein
MGDKVLQQRINIKFLVKVAKIPLTFMFYVTNLRRRNKAGFKGK